MEAKNGNPDPGRYHRARLAIIAIALFFLGKLPTLNSIGPLLKANQSLRMALEAVDPFVTSRHLYERLFSCNYDWRCRCLCKSWALTRIDTGACLQSAPIFPFNLLVMVPVFPFIVIAKIPGLPDGMIYAARQVAKEGSLALVLGLVTVIFVLVLLIDGLRSPGRISLREVVGLLALAPLVVSLLVLGLKLLFLIITWIFGVGLSAIVWGAVVLQVVMAYYEHFHMAETLGDLFGRLGKRKRTATSG